MRFLFSTGSLYTYGTARCFEFSARAGFDGVEVMVDDRWDTRQPAYLLELEQRYSMPILAVHSPFTPSVPGWPDGDVERLTRCIALAEALGAAVVAHHLPLRSGLAWVQILGERMPLPLPWHDPAGGYRRWLEGMYLIAQAGTPVALCIENMPARQALGARWNAHEWNTLEEIGRFGAITLDTTHLGTWSQDPLTVYAALAGKVRHVHLSNYDGREHRLPQHGPLALDQLLARMAADNYAHAVTLELSPDALRAGEDDETVLDELRGALDHCRLWAQRPPDQGAQHRNGGGDDHAT